VLTLNIAWKYNNISVDISREKLPRHKLQDQQANQNKYSIAKLIQNRLHFIGDKQLLFCQIALWLLPQLPIIPTTLFIENCGAFEPILKIGGVGVNLTPSSNPYSPKTGIAPNVAQVKN
jgi:hypothetical protein